MSRRTFFLASLGLAGIARAGTTTIDPGFWFPSHQFSATAQAFSSDLLDASNEESACVIRSPKTGTISKVFFRTGTVTTPQTLDVALQTVTAGTGFPSGSFYGGSSSGTLASPASNTGYVVALATPATTTRGDVFSGVIGFTSTVGNLNISRWQWGGGADATQYNVAFAGGAWAKNTSFPCVMGFEYSDGSYAYLGDVFAASATVSVTYNSGSTPDEYALKFSLPVQTVASAFMIQHGTLTGSLNLVLYDSDGTTALDTVNISTALAMTGAGPLTIPMTSTHTLLANTFYRIGILPTNGSNIVAYAITYPKAAALSQGPGGQTTYLSQRTDAGAWTDTTITMPLISVFLNGVVSSGGPKSTFIFD